MWKPLLGAALVLCVGCDRTYPRIGTMKSLYTNDYPSMYMYTYEGKEYLIVTVGNGTAMIEHKANKK